MENKSERPVFTIKDEYFNGQIPKDANGELVPVNVYYYYGEDEVDMSNAVPAYNGQSGELTTLTFPELGEMEPNANFEGIVHVKVSDSEGNIVPVKMAGRNISMSHCKHNYSTTTAEVVSITCVDARAKFILDSSLYTVLAIAVVLYLGSLIGWLESAGKLQEQKLLQGDH